MALSDYLLGQAGRSELGTIGNPKEFSARFKQEFTYDLTNPVAYVHATYTGGYHEHKFAKTNGFLVLTKTKLVFFPAIEPWIIEIPINKIDRDIMFVDSKGFTRFSLRGTSREKLLRTLEGMDISKEAMKIMTAMPYVAGASVRQRFNKTDVNSLAKMSLSIANAVHKRSLTIPYRSEWGLEKPVFFLGFSGKGLNEFVYELARIMLRKRKK